MPICDSLAIWAPPKTITAVELLFINPVKRAVDGMRSSIMGELDTSLGCEVFNIDIVLADKGNGCPFGIELCKHQGFSFKSLANLLELAGLFIENPIIATGVIAPHASCVRKDENF